MRVSKNAILFWSLLFAALFGRQVVAESPKVVTQWEYFSVDVEEVIGTFDESKIISDPTVVQTRYSTASPRVVVTKEADTRGSEAYLVQSGPPNVEYKGYKIVGRKPKGKGISGYLFLLRPHGDDAKKQVLAKLYFQVAANPKVTLTATAFSTAKGEYFQKYWSSDNAGSAMFRHLAIDSLKKVGRVATPTPPFMAFGSRRGAERTIALMAGGRAVSENLALNDELDDPDNYLGEMKDLSEVRGITVREIDWTNRLSKRETELDPLAKFVPHDQYAVFVPSFEMLTQIVDRGNDLARPLVQWFEPQSRVTDVLSMYQNQLGLPINALTRHLGGAMIGEVAITGSDPYFRTGTDLAVLMKTKQPDVLFQAIKAQVATESIKHSRVKQVDHKVGEHVFSEWSNPQRTLSSYVALNENTVIISNSLQQMIQVLKTNDKEVKSMHELDEYKFFRQRYIRGSENTAALIVITDAAIRRWCSPQWRISASRRTRARASIAEATMRHADSIIQANVETDRVFHSNDHLPRAGKMTLTSTGVHSDEYGTLDFQTPIAEMNLHLATKQEVALYNNWRNGYQRKWRRVFDPIALQINLTDNQMTADLSVIPLVLQSKYQQYVQLIGKSRLRSDVGERHKDSLASLDMALDLDAPMFGFVRMFVQSQVAGVNVDPLAWIDGSASVYFDYDEQWLKRFDARDPWNFQLNDLVDELPIALHVPSKDSLRLAAFLVGVRSLLSSSAPNMISWKTTKYKGYEYISGSPRDGSAAGVLRYVSLPDGLTVSGNAGVIERTIDRFIAKNDNPKRPAAAEPAKEEGSFVEPNERLDPQLAMQVTGKGIELMTQTNYDTGLQRLHRITWSNLPILNYLHDRFPEKDPLVVYETLFGQKLIEPTGGQYKWDEKVLSYVSTHHGFQQEPKVGPTMTPAIGKEDQIRTTISFQDGGLRATLSVTDNSN